MADIRSYELMLSALTLRTASFADRIPAAAAAGFTAIGLGAADYLDARRTGFSEADLRLYIQDHGLRVLELEFLRDWWADADVRGTRLEEDILLHLAELTGAEQINVGLFDQVPDDVIDTGFRRLCNRAEAHGLRIGLEFMPYSCLPTLEQARDIVRRSGASNAGVILDAWHWHRAGADLDSIAALGDVPVFSAQLGDALPHPMADLRFEGRHRRLLPGDGVIDLSAFLTALHDTGFSAPIALEVLSDELNAVHPRIACAEAARAARAALDSWVAEVPAPSARPAPLDGAAPSPAVPPTEPRPVATNV